MPDTPYILTSSDRVEIHELPGRSRICDGLDDIKSFMESEAAHPRTHMMTNIYADSDADGIRLNFRIVALIGKGKTSTASYYDKLVKTPDGWRTQHRFVSSRRRDKRDAEVDLNGIAL